MRKILSILLWLPLMGFSQHEDFQVWSSVDASYKWNKKLSFGIEQGLRTGHNSLLLNKTYTEATVHYNLLKPLKISGGYRFNQQYIGEKSLGHRLFADIKYTYKLDRLKLSYRLRYQHQSNYKREQNTFRNQLKLSYNLPKTPAEPFISAESFYTLRQGFDKYRYTAGVKYKFGKKLDGSVYYRYQHEVNTSSVENLSILGIGISYDLGKRGKKKKQQSKSSSFEKMSAAEFDKIIFDPELEELINQIDFNE